MAKHIVDKPRTGQDDRARPFLEIERGSGGPGKRERALQRAAGAAKDDGQRMREFLRIAREEGQQAE